MPCESVVFAETNDEESKIYCCDIIHIHLIIFMYDRYIYSLDRHYKWTSGVSVKFDGNAKNNSNNSEKTDINNNNNNSNNNKKEIEWN